MPTSLTTCPRRHFSSITRRTSTSIIDPVNVEPTTLKDYLIGTEKRCLYRLDTPYAIEFWQKRERERERESLLLLWYIYIRYIYTQRTRDPVVVYGEEIVREAVFGSRNEPNLPNLPNDKQASKQATILSIWILEFL